MLRKQIIKPTSSSPALISEEINVVSAATVLVTSEHPEHPVDYAFDSHRGAGRDSLDCGRTRRADGDRGLRRLGGGRPSHPGG
jgi:hypothetical protein